MPLLQSEAEKLSVTDMERGVIEEIIKSDPLYSLLPFARTANKTYSYNRENTLGASTYIPFISPNESISEESADFTEVVTQCRILAEHVDIDKFIINTTSDNSSQVAVQLAAKAKKMGHSYSNALVNGDNSVNSKSFDGLKALVTNDQTLSIATNGASISFEALDELLEAVPLGADVLMMRKGTWRAIRSLLRAQGGNVAETIMLNNFGKPVPAYDGKPVILNDFVNADETVGTTDNTASVWALRLNEDDGFHGLYAGEEGTGAGFVIEPPMTLQDKDAYRWRAKWYCGCVLKSTVSIARLTGVTNT